MSPPEAETPKVVHDGANTVRISGDLTFETVPDAIDAVADRLSATRALTVDLAGVGRSDSAAVALLIEWYRLARRDGGSIRFVNMPSRMHEIARVSGVESVLSID